jgi:hypothetical protein
VIRPKTWGVCTPNSPRRSTVRRTRSPSASFSVSTTGSAGATASQGAPAPRPTGDTSSGADEGRAASCTATTSASGGRACSPRSTDSARVRPPAQQASTRSPELRRQGSAAPCRGDRPRDEHDRLDRLHRGERADAWTNSGSPARGTKRLRVRRPRAARPIRRRRSPLRSAHRRAVAVRSGVGSGRCVAKTMRPCGLDRMLVTSAVTSEPWSSRAPSTTTIVPSDR